MTFGPDCSLQSKLNTIWTAVSKSNFLKKSSSHIFPFYKNSLLNSINTNAFHTVM